MSSAAAATVAARLLYSRDQQAVFDLVDKLNVARSKAKVSGAPLEKAIIREETEKEKNSMPVVVVKTSKKIPAKPAKKTVSSKVAVCRPFAPAKRGTTT